MPGSRPDHHRANFLSRGRGKPRCVPPSLFADTGFVSWTGQGSTKLLRERHHFAAAWAAGASEYAVPAAVCGDGNVPTATTPYHLRRTAAAPTGEPACSRVSAQQAQQCATGTRAADRSVHPFIRSWAVQVDVRVWQRKLTVQSLAKRAPRSRRRASLRQRSCPSTGVRGGSSLTSRTLSGRGAAAALLSLAATHPASQVWCVTACACPVGHAEVKRLVHTIMLASGGVLPRPAPVHVQLCRAASVHGHTDTVSHPPAPCTPNQTAGV